MQHYTNIVKLGSQFQKGNFMHSCCPAVNSVWAHYKQTCCSCDHSSCDHSTTRTVQSLQQQMH
jgi:Rad3-related DNA helicase